MPTINTKEPRRLLPGNVEPARPLLVWVDKCRRTTEPTQGTAVHEECFLKELWPNANWFALICHHRDVAEADDRLVPLLPIMCDETTE